MGPVHRPASRLARRVVHLWLVLVVVLAVPASAREKTDVITLANGDRITGEVRQLALGFLSVKTDSMGMVKIEWPDVARIQSSQHFEVEEESGERHYGVITPADEAGHFVVITTTSEIIDLEHDRIVRIMALEDSWKERWRGFIDFGFNITSASSSTQLSLNSEATYRSEDFIFETTLTSSITDREEVDRLSWTTLSSSYERTLRDRWFWIGLAKLEQNEEGDLDLRSTASIGAGRYVRQTNRNVLSLIGGVAGNRETYSFDPEDGGEVEQTDSQWTAEAVLSVRHDFFLFGDHETSLSTTLTLFPSLSDWGRVRADLTTSFRRELVADFTIGLSLTDSYDSDPGSTRADKNDIRLVSSLGWSF